VSSPILNAAQAVLVEDEHVVTTLAPDGTDQPFDISILPRGAWRTQDLPDVHGISRLMKPFSVTCVTVTQ
jgi:hypothetical protein